MPSDFFYIILWWAYFFLVGLITLPTTFLFFRRFVDIGYGLSKTVGFLIISYLVFLFSVLRLLPFTREVILLLSFIFLALNIFLFFKIKKEFLRSVKKRLKIIIFQEIFFTLGLVLWSMVRGYQPDINGLEKFMDFGFINSLLRTTYLPPPDMWYAGSSINYYWFGHFWTALITKLTGIPSEITYNLMLATIMGLTLVGVFTLVSTLIRTLNNKAKKLALLGGLLSALLVTFGGSFHTPIYVLREGKDKYWYPDATRFIGYNPETNDKTIHEFPLYSFVVSDLHAHIINLPVVILFIGLIFKTLVFDKNRSLLQKTLPLGFLLGVMFMTSTWDFGNYLLLTGFSGLIFKFRKLKISVNKIVSFGAFIGGVLFSGLTFALPFIFNFQNIAKGVGFVNSRTPLWQLGVLWGFPAVLTLLFIFSILRIKKLPKPDLFIISLLVASWTLIVIPEIIYVKDIYIASHHRANTMFKLTYQAFVMFYVTSGYIAAKSLISARGLIKKFAVFIFFGVLFSGILWYSKFAINSYYNDLKEYKGLAGNSWLKLQKPNVYSAVLWFNKNINGQPVILEASGDSYTEFNVISSYTGLPTVSGWFVHEWLWRGEASVPQARVNDITQIYTSQNNEDTRNLLDKYDVKYVVIGEFEREKFPNLNIAKFQKLGELVFKSGNLEIFEIN